MVAAGMTSRPPAAAVDHRPQPMLVGEVCTEGVGVPVALTSILSAARPKSLVMAMTDR